MHFIKYIAGIIVCKISREINFKEWFQKSKLKISLTYLSNEISLTKILCNNFIQILLVEKILEYFNYCSSGFVENEFKLQKESFSQCYSLILGKVVMISFEVFSETCFSFLCE